MSEASRGAALVNDKFADAVIEQGEFHGQDFVTVKAEAVHDVVAALRDEGGFAMLEDLTAVDYLDRPDVEGRFRVGAEHLDGHVVAMGCFGRLTHSVSALLDSLRWVFDYI